MSTVRVDSMSVPAHAPQQHPAPVLEFTALAAVMGATAKKTRRTAGAKRTSVPLWLDSEVHVIRDDKETPAAAANRRLRGVQAPSPHTVIPGGVLVDDTDLTDDEIEDLQRRGVVRPATPKEVESAEVRERTERIAELQREQEREIQQLRADQEQEKAKINADGKAAPDAVAKLADKQSKELTSLQEKHVKALNAEQAK